MNVRAVLPEVPMDLSRLANMRQQNKQSRQNKDFVHRTSTLFRSVYINTINTELFLPEVPAEQPLNGEFEALPQIQQDTMPDQCRVNSSEWKNLS